MSREEAKAKIDALTPETKGWLHRACNQLADCAEYIPNDAARSECVDAGLVAVFHDDSMEVGASVMGLVYSNNYLRDFQTK
jgi:hypothetical protein